MMTVGALRVILEGLPDDMRVVGTYDDGVCTGEIDVAVCAPTQRPEVGACLVIDVDAGLDEDADD